jgi:uncharacterized protein (DUF2336 family)
MAARDDRYEKAKAFAQGQDPAMRAAIALRDDVAPEIMLLLAEDPDPEVRRAVAANPATPHNANMILAHDRNYGVRCAVAHKIVGTGLGGEARRRLWRMGFTILETLAQDQLVRVRRIVARGVKSDKDAPRPIVKGLARDREEDVAAPVLENSPVLTDADLMEVLDAGAPSWAQEAVAGRAELSADVADAIVRREQPAAVRRLIENRGAKLGTASIERIVARAPEIESWHAPLAERPSLPQGAIRALARFIAGPLLKVMRRAQTLDAETARELDRQISVRGDDPRPATAKIDRAETPEERAIRLARAGGLNDEVVSLALSAGERDFVTAALALRAGMAPEEGRRIVASKSAKAVTALAWKGKFPMRFALDVQLRLANIPPDALVYARGGMDYPLTPAEMNWHLELFTG